MTYQESLNLFKEYINSNIILKDSHNETFSGKIKEFIPIYNYDETTQNWYFRGLEILFNKKRNYYVNAQMFLEDKSWAKKIIIISDSKKREKRLFPKTKLNKISENDLTSMALIFNNFLKNIESSKI